MTKHSKQNSKITQAEHHLHRRKLPARQSFSAIDRLVVFTGPLIPIAVFAQAYNVWILGKVDGLSIITWTMLLIASVTMAIYAIKHQSKPLVITYIPLVLANGLVVGGILTR